MEVGVDRGHPRPGAVVDGEALAAGGGGPVDGIEVQGAVVGGREGQPQPDLAGVVERTDPALGLVGTLEGAHVGDDPHRAAGALLDGQAGRRQQLQVAAGGPGEQGVAVGAVGVDPVTLDAGDLEGRQQWRGRRLVGGRALAGGVEGGDGVGVGRARHGAGVGVGQHLAERDQLVAVAVDAVAADRGAAVAGRRLPRQRHARLAGGGRQVARRRGHLRRRRRWRRTGAQEQAVEHDVGAGQAVDADGERAAGVDRHREVQPGAVVEVGVDRRPPAARSRRRW